MLRVSGWPTRALAEVFAPLVQELRRTGAFLSGSVLRGKLDSFWDFLCALAVRVLIYVLVRGRVACIWLAAGGLERRTNQINLAFISSCT